MTRARSEQVLARRFGSAGRPGRQPVQVLVEEPLEIRIGDELRATTMRTPGHDFELAAGWAWAEGQIAGPPQEVRYCATGSAVDTEFNVVTVDPGDDAPPPASSAAPRLGVMSSSCGICGTVQVDQLVERLEPLPVPSPLDAAVIAAAGDAVMAHQELFALTGGSHAAAALGTGGDVLVVREDIGRHNAVDKVVGRILLDGGIPAGDRLLWVSGRAGFEIVQKAWAAGFVALVAVGAPSALAVETAERAGLVLAGFARGEQVTVYAGAEHVAHGVGSR